MRKHVITCASLNFLFLVSGCSPLPKQSDEIISQLVKQRSGKSIYWNQGSKEDEQIAESTQLILQHPLSLNEAIHLSLLHNRSLQALYEEIGISQAEIVQAGLLRNPVLGATWKFPHNSSLSTGYELSIAQNFIDIFSIPLRKKCAQIQFEQTQLHIAHAVLEHIAAVQAGYYHLQAELQRFNISKKLVEALEVAHEIAQRQKVAGNVYDNFVAARQKALCEAKIGLAQCESEILRLREHMNQLLGLWGYNTAWTIPETLENIPQTELDLTQLESLAIGHRLDLLKAKKRTELLAKRLGLKEWWTYTEANIGLAVEKGSDGDRSTLPSLSFELPIFDSGQSQRSILAAQLRQSYQEIRALAVNIRAEVRAARDALVLSRELVDYHLNVILPLHQKNVDFNQKLYNSMSIGVYELLEQKQEELKAHIQYSIALRNYWLARVDIEKKIGGKLILSKQSN